MIKLIVSDMDDSLVVNGAQKLPLELPNILQQLYKKGITFSVASGRPYLGLKRIFKNFPHQDMIYISDNGALITRNDQILHKEPLPVKFLKKALHLLENLPYTSIVLCHIHGIYLLNCKREFQTLLASYFDNCKSIDTYTYGEDILKISIFFHDGVNPIVEKKLKMAMCKDVIIRQSGQEWLDIHSLQTNKGIALKHIQKLLRVSYEESMVFGNFYNDLELLSNAHYSYAMKNSPQEVKQYANFTTNYTSQENGVVKTLQDFFSLR